MNQALKDKLPYWHFDGELISCDSRQIYKGMDIGTNKDYSYPHYLFDIVTPDERFTVADFKKLAIEKIDEILNRGKLPILVGGTAMYVTALLQNWQMPENQSEPEKADPLYNDLLMIIKMYIC